ncbi:Transducin-like enhancer protein 3 [Echinococcus granulosus]|uniref:Groucho 2 n=1 Tax=Echinococcus granulosus TaxID=6210 RepID=A0A068WGE9_ECHGR|nr:Transducin-like enhancer protein 3 [Echinococcus granulosus]CDS16675.1 groucho 2 [Echinococcus granulosus]
MYPPRQNVGSQQNQTKFSVPDACDRIKDELSYLQQQCHTLKVECERLTQEKTELHRVYMVYYELAYGLNVEIHKQVNVFFHRSLQTEISKRLGAIIAQVLPYLPQEHQAQVAAAVERAKQVTLPELNNLISQHQLLFAGANPIGGQLAAAFPPPGIPGLPQPPSSTVNGAGALSPSPAGGVNSLSGTLLSLPGAPPNPFAPPITSASGPNVSTTTPNAGAFLGAPTSTSPGFPNSNLAQSQSAMAAAMAAMAAGLQTNSAAAFGFPNSQTPNSSPAGLAANSLLPNMMSPTALSALMGDKSMDEKQRAAAAAAVAAAMTAAVAQQQCGGLTGVDPTAMMATIANMSQSAPGAGFDLSHTACAAAAAAAAAAGVLPPPPPAPAPPQPPSCLPSAPAPLPEVPPTAAAVPPIPPLPSSAEPPRLHSPQALGASSPTQPARASSTLGFVDSKRRRLDNDVVMNGTAAAIGHSPHENGGGSTSCGNDTKLERNRASTPNTNAIANSNGENRSPLSPSALNLGTPFLSTNNTAVSPKPSTSVNAQLPVTSTPIGEAVPSLASVTPIPPFLAGATPTTPSLPTPMTPFPGGPPPPPGLPGLMTSTPTHPSLLSRFPGPLPPGAAAPPPPSNFLRPPGASPGSISSIPFDGSFRTSTLAVGRTTYSYVYMEGQPPAPITMPPEVCSGPGIPHSTKVIQTIEHGEVVCAVMINSSTRHIYTGGKGTVKLWDLAAATAERAPTVSKSPLATMDCLQGGNYIRSIKMGQEGNLLVVGGEANVVSIWDMGGLTPRPKGEIDIGVQACYAVAVSNDSKLCYFCQSDGVISVWDLHNQSQIRRLQGHGDGASCVDLSATCAQLWTGGLDKTVRNWDIREMHRQIAQFNFNSQIFSLAKSPTEEWVAAGMESDEIELFAPGRMDRYQLRMHESCVLSLKFAHSGVWFASTGKDSWLNAWRPPWGANLFRVKESLSVLSCDISADDRHLVTGSGDRRASIYEINY